ncbi:hypothetical protein U8607_13315 [Methylobacterium durans]|uniref:hypothetical protein n=1 Tax=Methylobacterium durans TaxID=2202825 RepID=UPI002AFFB595|nr:hypothetical protein [Methylobacterium durans]MEA1833061.1 hypothetical protein [Methylobacterium durans]
MRVSFAILGVSAISALLLTAGYRTTLPDGPGPGSVPSAAAPQAWIDPPRRATAQSTAHRDGDRDVRAAEPATTGTLVQIAASPPPLPDAAMPHPMAQSAPLKRDRVAGVGNARRPGHAQATRKAPARKAGPAPAEAAADPPEPQAAAPRQVALGGPLGDILRGLGLVEGQRPPP